MIEHQHSQTPSRQLLSGCLTCRQWTSRGRSRPAIASAGLRDGTASPPARATQKPVPAVCFHFSISFLFFHLYRLAQWSLVRSRASPDWILVTSHNLQVAAYGASHSRLTIAVEPVQVSFPKSFSVTFYSSLSPFIWPVAALKFASDAVSIFTIGWWSST